MQLTTTHLHTATISQQKSWKELGIWLENLKQIIAKALFVDNSELQVHQFMNGSDLMWYAFDPRTGQSVYADSEAELRIWIEDNYYGR